MTDDEIISAMASADDPLIRVSAEVHALLKNKGQDYNAEIGRDAYWAFGAKSIVQMLWVKVLRLRNLLSTGKPPKHESVEDTAKDLVSYALFLVEYMRRTNG